MSDSMDERLISPKAKRGRNGEIENEDNKDRLSDFPDGILLHILSFAGVKCAVRTCVLSTKWENLWKRLPTLHLHMEEVAFAFVPRLLPLFDKSAVLDNLDIDHVLSIKPQVIERIVTYARSHKVKQLRIHADFNMHSLLPCIFSCKSLTSLKLEVLPSFCRKERKIFPESLSLPALTTLDLRNFTFCSSDPFSGFSRLDSLIIIYCNLKDAGTLCISSATLVKLTVCYLHRASKLELSTPSLHRFACTDLTNYYLSGSGLSSIKEVYIDTLTTIYKLEYALVLLSWLHDLVNMTSLTVTANTLQFLFVVPDLLKIKLPSLANLKRLKVVIERAASESHKEADKLCNTRNEQTAPLPDGIVDFLIQNSPSAEVKIIDCLM